MSTPNPQNTRRKADQLAPEVMGRGSNPPLPAKKQPIKGSLSPTKTHQRTVTVAFSSRTARVPEYAPRAQVTSFNASASDDEGSLQPEVGAAINPDGDRAGTMATCELCEKFVPAWTIDTMYAEACMGCQSKTPRKVTEDEAARLASFIRPPNASMDRVRSHLDASEVSREMGLLEAQIDRLRVEREQLRQENHSLKQRVAELSSVEIGYRTLREDILDMRESQSNMVNAAVGLRDLATLLTERANAIVELGRP